MRFTTFLIDLDETVYPTESGVWPAISKRMELYMHQRLNMNWEEIPNIRKSLYQQYGTTLRGLQSTRSIDEADFLAFVHDIPLDEFLEPALKLRGVLKRYKQQKIIFTNADRNHANRVIKHLKLEGCFDGLIDIFTIAPFCKPMPESFHIALEQVGEIDPGRCVFLDDSPHNLSAARDLGFYTIQVGNPKPGYLFPDSRAHARIAQLHELPAIIAPDD